MAHSSKRCAVAVTAAVAVLLLASTAFATPACPPGTGAPPHLGWYFGAPFLIGAAISIPLFVSGVRHEKARLIKILGALAIGGAGLLIGAVAFLLFLSSCVPQ